MVRARAGTVVSCTTNSITIECKNDHTWKTTKIALESGRWCPQCEMDEMKNTEIKCQQIITNKNGILMNTYNKDDLKIRCDRDHIFISSAQKILSNEWCKICNSKNKTETKLYEWLTQVGVSFTTQHIFPWTEKPFRYDFVIEDIKLIIEVDGDQHFRKVSNWSDPEITRDSDVRKTFFAMTHDYSVIRIYQPDVWNDTIPWKSKLLQYLKVWDPPILVFLTSDIDLYDTYLDEMKSLISLEAKELTKSRIDKFNFCR